MAKKRLGDVPYKSGETSDRKISARLRQEPINIINLLLFHSLILYFLASLSTIPYIYSLQIKVEMIVGTAGPTILLIKSIKLQAWCPAYCMSDLVKQVKDVKE